MKDQRHTPIAVIVAAAKNWVIGHQQAMPWYLPEELGYFKRKTWGKPIIMGRATFESIGRPLPGRTNIVISRQSDYAPAGVKVVPSLEAALTLADQQAQIDGAEEIMVIGGGQIYQQAFALADRLYLTEVDAEPEGDTWFPAVQWDEWQLVSEQAFAAGEGNRYAYRLLCLDRRAVTSAES
ncbi:dihydrofolate reductase [Marinospirillum sp.]|uniref:dihydrofolate reductase n=1 Tax=Marinospirillum sp. TaxID=2183934 RepID=UPI003A86512C